jgi:hypothetical protein
VLRSGESPPIARRGAGRRAGRARRSQGVERTASHGWGKLAEVYAVLCESVEGRGRHARTVARPKLAALATSSRGSSAIDRSGTGMYGISASTFDSRTHTRRKPGSQSHGSSPPPRRRPPNQPLTPEESTTAEPPQNRRSIRDSGPCLLRMVPCQGAGVKRRLERASVVEANQTQ